MGADASSCRRHQRPPTPTPHSASPSCRELLLPRQRASPFLAVFPLAAVCVRLLGFVSPPASSAGPSQPRLGFQELRLSSAAQHIGRRVHAPAGMAFPASPTPPLVELAALSCTRTPCLLSFLRRDGRGSGLTPAAAQRPTPIQQSASLHPTAEGSFPGNERARSPPALLSQPSCSGQAARLRLRHLAAGPRPALCGYHESQPSRLPASEPSRRGRARSPRSHHSRAMTRTGHSLLLSRPRPTCRSSRRRPVRTPCLRSLRWAQTHRPAGGTSGRRRPLRTQPLPPAESCCCPGNERVRSSLSFLSQRNCCLPPPSIRRMQDLSSMRATATWRERHARRGDRHLHIALHNASVRIDRGFRADVDFWQQRLLH